MLLFCETLKMDTVCLSETLVSTYESTRRQSLEKHRHPQRRDKLKSNTKIVYHIPTETTTEYLFNDSVSYTAVIRGIMTWKDDSREILKKTAV